MKKSAFLILFINLNLICFSQDWTLKLSSNVELRTWKLTSKAEKNESALGGASIVLTKGSNVVSQTSSNGNGDFTIEVPANGDFILTVSYTNCNPKKFAISTKGVPDNVAKDNFHPTYSIGGFIMAKPFPGIDYSGLQQTLVKVVYFNKGQKFDDDETATEQGLNVVSKIAEAENTLINNFCSTNKSGDAALAKPDCPLAKMLYEKAISIIPGEPYPVEQLAKVGECLKQKEEAAKQAAAESAAKEEAKKVAAEKEAAEKLAGEKAATEKAEAAKLAKQKETDEKAAEKKLAAEKLAAEKAEANKTKQQAVEQKNIKEKTTVQQNVNENKAGEKTVTNNQTKSNAVFKQKEIDNKTAAEALERAQKQKEKSEKLAKQKEGMERSKAEDEAAMKADYEKEKARRLEREKEKAEKEKLSRETKKKDGEGEMGKGNSKYKVPQVLGANKYKDIILKADDYYKTKRYKEAKLQYQEALKQKPDDPYATGKLSEIEKILTQK